MTTRTMWKAFGAALAGALLLAAAPAGAQAPAPAGKMVGEVKERGRLRVGMASFVPWAMRDKAGEWIGFEIDVAKKLAADWGVQLELVPTAWDGIIPALAASKFDAIVGGLSITPARQEAVDFSTPYSQSGVGVAASKKLAAKLKWPEDYDSADVTFTCKRGIYACGEVQRAFPKAVLRQFDDTAVGFQEVINGNAHATVSSEPAPTFYVLQNPDALFQPTKDYLVKGVEGIAVRKGDAASLATIDAWIKGNDAWLKERHAYWFRTRDWAGLVAQ